MDIRYIIIVAWLNTSLSNQCGVRMNMSVWCELTSMKCRQ